MIAIEISQNEEISGEGRKGIGSPIHRREANRGGVHIKKRERGGVERDVDLYIIRVGIKQEKRGGGQFKEG